MKEGKRKKWEIVEKGDRAREKENEMER
jgi:hypothetical protein